MNLAGKLRPALLSMTALTAIGSTSAIGSTKPREVRL